MKHWCLTFCLVIVALFGSVGVGSAAGPCEGDDYEQYRNCTKKGTDSCSYRVSDFGSSRGRITKSVTTYKNGDKLIRVPDGSQTTYDGPPYFNSGDTYFFANGDKYVGSWRWSFYSCDRPKSEVNGEGTYTYSDGRIAKGVWKDGGLLSSQTQSSVAKSSP